MVNPVYLFSGFQRAQWPYVRRSIRVLERVSFLSFLAPLLFLPFFFFPLLFSPLTSSSFFSLLYSPPSSFYSQGYQLLALSLLGVRLYRPNHKFTVPHSAYSSEVSLSMILEYNFLPSLFEACLKNWIIQSRTLLTFLTRLVIATRNPVFFLAYRQTMVLCIVWIWPQLFSVAEHNRRAH